MIDMASREKDRRRRFAGPLWEQRPSTVSFFDEYWEVAIRSWITNPTPDTPLPPLIPTGVNHGLPAPASPPFFENFSGPELKPHTFWPGASHVVDDLGE
jgi:hypothetical protein